MHYQYECRNSSECIAIYNVCDGITQCSDGSDEAIDLECHKSRFNVPNPTQIVAMPQNMNLDKTLNNKESEKKANEAKLEPSISIYQHESRIPTNRASQALPVYNYPKTADSEKMRSSVEQTVVPKKHNFSPSGEREIKNGYNSQYRGAWNQYYQPNDAYNGGDSRLSSSGYLVEPEYLNSYGNNREPSANSGSYWPSNGRQQSYDLSDQLLSSGSQSYLPLSNKQQNIGDDWQQSNDNSYYDHISRTGINKQKTMVRPVSQETSSDSKPYQKPQQIQTQSALKAKQEKSDSGKQFEQQLKSESKQKDESNKQLTNNQPTGYSHLASNKGYIDSSNIVAVSYMHDSSQQSGRETNSAVIALSLGLFVTALLVVLVGCRMKSFKRKIARRGRTLAHDADYLVNGMYL